MLNSKKTTLQFGASTLASIVSVDYTKMLDLKCENIPECLKIIFGEAVKLALPVAVVLVFWSGFLYVTAMGNKNKIEQAHKTLLWVVVGIFIIVGAWALAVAFQEFFHKEL